MAGFIDPEGRCHDIFGKGGGEREASRLGIPFLGSLPLDPELRIAGDAGEPLVLSLKPGPVASLILGIAGSLSEHLPRGGI
jgi:hypothetical protein